LQAIEAGCSELLSSKLGNCQSCHAWIISEYAEAQEKKIHAAIQLIQAITQQTAGWYTGRTKSKYLKLLAERDDLIYCATSYCRDFTLFTIAAWEKPLD